MAEFATADDVATRLGRSLTAAEVLFCQAVIEDVTGLICDAVGEPRTWADSLSPVPGTLRTLCIEKTLRAVTQNRAHRSSVDASSASAAGPQGRDDRLRHDRVQTLRLDAEVIDAFDDRLMKRI